MDTGLPPLEFTDCLVDSPFFRENLHAHEKELERTSQQIKRLVKEVKDLINAAKNLSFAQRKLSKSLENFSFAGIAMTQTDDERVIQESLKEFGGLIAKIEDVRDRILECSYDQIIVPLEKFRKEKIGQVKDGKKKFEKQTAKFCQSQERYLNLSTKKQDSQLKEADATLDMEERELCQASLQYVFLLQEVEERKKFEFVETLLSFLFSWLAFYHQGHDVYGEFMPYMTELQLKIQKTRENFIATRDKTESLMMKMLEMRQQKPLDPTIVKSSFTREGYLFLMEKKAFGTTWTKQYCRYKKDTKEFEMIPYNQMTTKQLNSAEKIKLASCTRRMSDSIEKRFCFDLMSADKPGIVFTLQALSEQDRKMWMDAMDGKEPTYALPGNIPKTEERQLDETGMNFVKKCIEVLEARGLEEQGLYRVVGVNSKVNKLLSMGLDRRKAEKLSLDDPFEWESKTITSALKTYLRNLPEPLMTYRLHEQFIDAAKKNSSTQRVNSVHALVQKLPAPNFQMLEILIKHLTSVAAKSEKNLMSISNLGVCFGPTLLRPEEETVAAILNIKFGNIVVEIMIENYERIFKTQPDAMDSSEYRTHSQGNHREVNHKYNQQPIYGHTGHGNSAAGGGGGSNQGSPSSTPHVRAPPRHQYSSQTNPVTHTVIKTFYNDGPTTVNLSSSLSSVPSSVREREFLPGRVEHNNTGADRGDVGHTSNYWPGAAPGRVASSVATFSESNLHSMNTHQPFELAKHRPGYQYSTTVTADRHEPLNSNSSSNESVSSRDGHDLYSTGELYRKDHYASEHYREPEYYKRGFGKDNEVYTSSELYPPSTGIPQKGTRNNLGIHPLPLYRPQIDNVIPFSYSSDTSKFNISGHNSSIDSGIRRVRTLYACLGENDGELSFDPNQIITNVRPSLEPGWLEGTLNGKTGLIPENYVEVLP